MFRLRPPQHRADQPGHFIHPDDPARDADRIAVEIGEMETAYAAAAAAAPAEYAKARGLEVGELTPAQVGEAVGAAVSGLRRRDHPLEVYWSGESRYDLQAQGLFMGKPVNVREYFTKATPTVFTLRRLTWAEWNRLVSIDDARTRLFAFARAGVVAIEGPGVDLKVKTGEEIPEAWMQALWEADHDWGVVVGAAVVRYNAPLTESEKKGAAPARVEI